MPWTVRDVLKGIVFFVVAQVVLFGIILGIVLLVHRYAEQVPTTALIFVAMLVGEPVMLLAAWRFSAFKYRSGWRSLGFCRPTTLTKAVWIVVVALILLFLANFIYSLIIVLFDVKLLRLAESPLEEYVETLAWRAAYAVLLILVAPVVEETFFRGFVFPGIGRRYGVWWGATVSAALFAVMHVSLGALFPLFVMGLLLAWVYLRTRSIWPCIGFHAAYNSVALILMVS